MGIERLQRLNGPRKVVEYAKPYGAWRPSPGGSFQLRLKRCAFLSGYEPFDEKIPFSHRLACRGRCGVEARLRIRYTNSAGRNRIGAKDRSLLHLGYYARMLRTACIGDRREHVVIGYTCERQAFLKWKA